MNYGLHYMGSKNRIANWVLDNLPDADNFYDLFGGGGAITHAALLSEKYKHIYYNDIQDDLVQLFKDSINGKYKDETDWISREDFFNDDIDCTGKPDSYKKYIKVCWSFGNNYTNYLYSKEIEKYKRAWHYAVVYDDYSLIDSLGIKIEKADSKLTTKEKRLFIGRQLKKLAKNGRAELQSLQSLENLERLERLQNLESLERLQSLERLENLERLEFSSKSYDDFSFKENSVIYCDIPYKNTAGYVSGEFDYNKFYEWALKQKNIYISEYTMPDDFVAIAEKEVSRKLNGVKSSKCPEKIWVPKCNLS